VVRGGNIPTMTAPSSVFIFVFFTHLVGSLNIIFCIHSPSVFWGHSGIFYPDTIVFFGYRVTKKKHKTWGNTPKIIQEDFYDTTHSRFTSTRCLFLGGIFKLYSVLHLFVVWAAGYIGNAVLYYPRWRDTMQQIGR